MLSVIRSYHALITQGGTPAGSLMVYGWVADPLDVANAGALYSFEIAVADIIMVRSPSTSEMLRTLTTSTAIPPVDRVGT